MRDYFGRRVTHHSSRITHHSSLSSINFPKHDVQRSDQRDHVGDKMPDRHPLKRLQIDVRRRTNTHTIRLARSIAHHEHAKLALGSFYRVIYFADRRFDYLRNLGHHRTFGQSVERLLDDHRRLLHLFHANEVAIVRIAVLADRYLKIEVRICRIGLGFANVVFDSGSAQRRPGQAEIDSFFGWEDAYAD